MRVILCRPGEKAEVVEIDGSLESMQELVGGMIEEYDPFYSDSDPREENVILVCNEEGKMLEMTPCRAVADEEGRVMDVIAGPFFLCYSPVDSENFESMPPDLEEKYLRKFEYPERFIGSNRGIIAVRYDPAESTGERDQER